jgi:hypothetical protein
MDLRLVRDTIPGMDTFARRLARLIDLRGTNPHALDMRLDAAKVRGRNYTGRILAGKEDTRARAWSYLAEWLGTSVEYLVTGREPEAGGQPAILPTLDKGAGLTEEERALLIVARELEGGVREAIARVANASAPWRRVRDRDPGTFAPPDGGAVPDADEEGLP